MADNINKTYPKMQTLTLTVDQDKALKALALQQGRDVRSVLRDLVDSATAVDRLRMRFTPQLQGALEETAQLLKTTPDDLVARYTTAGVTHDLMRLGILPRPEGDTP
jgi:hypothetical protein